jgi:hypothetical protein
MSLTGEDAAYLQQASLRVRAADGTVAANFGADAVTIRAQSPLQERSDAAAEAQRQLAFRAGPLVPETHRVAGEHDQLTGRTVTIDGETCFVTGCAPQAGRAVTLLSVLRRLS